MDIQIKLGTEIQGKLNKLEEQLNGLSPKGVSEIKVLFENNFNLLINKEPIFEFALLETNGKLLKGTYLENLIPKKGSEMYQDIKGFAIKGFARLIYELLEWEGQDLREVNDWLTAEKYIEHLEENLVEAMTERYLILSTYNLLRKDNPSEFPGISNDVTNSSTSTYNLFPNIRKYVCSSTLEGITELISIKYLLKNSPEEQVKDLVKKVIDGDVEDNKYLFLHGDLYGLVSKSMNSDSSYLHSKGYVRNKS